MANYSGIYQHYAGTTAQCNAVQQLREIVFIQDSGSLRFKDCSGNYYYLGAKGDKGDIGTVSTTGSSGYLSVFSSSSGIVTSIVFQSGNNLQVGSNINNNLYKLYVDGSGKFTNLDIYNLISSGNGLFSGNLTINSTGIFNIITVTNTGVVSNLNSDYLDGQHGNYYLNRANQSGTQAWSSITGTPTTLVGYGITDGISGVVDTSSIDLTLNSGKISGVVLPAGVDHNSLSNYDANKHIDHTSVSISAGSGLSGGGTISATRTLSISEGNINHASLYNINSTNYTHLTATNHTDLTDGGATTLHKHDHGGLDGLGDNDHTMYVSGVIDTSSLDLSLSNQAISGVVLPAGVNHDLLLNYSGNKHVDHTLVSIATGSGLSGGGTIASTRTLTVSEGNVNHASLYNLNSANYTHLTATNHNDLTDSGDSTLHYHASDRSYTDNISGALNIRINNSGAYSANVSGILNTYITNTSGILNDRINLKSFSSNITGTSGYLAQFNTTSGVVNSTIYQSGTNIGIRTTNPLYPLDIYGSSIVPLNLRRDSGSEVITFNNLGTEYGSIGVNSTAMSIYAKNSATLTLWTGSTLTERMVITNTGNVGIGTTNPSGKLDVFGSTGDIVLRVGNSDEIGRAKLFWDNTNLRSGLTSWSTSGYKPINVDCLNFNVTTGNVGVGTSSPIASLDILSPSGTLHFKTSDSSNMGLYISSGRPTNGGYAELNCSYDINATHYMWINYAGYQNSSGQFRDLYIGNGKANPIAIFRGSNQYVGIGTTGQTDYQLDVRNYLTTSSVMLNLQGPIGTGQRIGMSLGAGASTGDCARLYYYWTNSNHASNKLDFTFYGKESTPVMTLWNSDVVTIGTVTPYDLTHTLSVQKNFFVKTDTGSGIRLYGELSGGITSNYLKAVPVGGGTPGFLYLSIGDNHAIKLDEAGDTSVLGKFGCNGNPPVGKAATATTLAQVITCLQDAGLMS